MNTPRQRGGQAADVAWLLSDEALEIGRRAVEDELVELRDARIGQLRNNGLVVKERDGSPSDIIRLGPEDALRIGLRAMLTSAPPAPSVGGVVDEREAFEAWAERTGRHLYKVTPCDGSKPQYLDACATMAWEAWQARAALAREGGA